MAFSKKQALASCPLFGALEEDYLDKLLPTAHLRKFDDGGLLFLKGKKADGFFLVLAGEIEVFCISSQGRRQVLHVIGPGQLCGEVPLFAGGKYPASARARGALKTLYIDGAEFMAVACEHPEILLEMLAVLSGRLRRFVSLVENLSLRDATARVGAYIAALPDRDGTVTLDCSKADLAVRLGTIPETVSRSLAKLKKQGAITMRAGRIVIKDRSLLTAM